MAGNGSSGMVMGHSAAFQTGIGPLDVRRPKVPRPGHHMPAEKKVRFTSSILPKWARRSKSLDA
ncbi:hypothetical protein GA0071312_3481, partial [Saliniramus fredricksonii]